MRMKRKELILVGIIREKMPKMMPILKKLLLNI
jgi:hypothetical protein